MATICVLSEQERLWHPDRQARLGLWRDIRRVSAGSATLLLALAGYMEDEGPDIVLLSAKAGAPEDCADGAMLAALSDRLAWHRRTTGACGYLRQDGRILSFVTAEEASFRRENSFGLCETIALTALYVTHW